jgi:hypothetical protein
MVALRYMSSNRNIVWSWWFLLSIVPSNMQLEDLHGWVEVLVTWNTVLDYTPVLPSWVGLNSTTRHRLNFGNLEVFGG